MNLLSMDRSVKHLTEKNQPPEPESEETESSQSQLSQAVSQLDDLLDTTGSDLSLRGGNQISLLIGPPADQSPSFHASGLRHKHESTPNTTISTNDSYALAPAQMQLLDALLPALDSRKQPIIVSTWVTPLAWATPTPSVTPIQAQQRQGAVVAAVELIALITAVTRRYPIPQGSGLGVAKLRASGEFARDTLITMLENLLRAITVSDFDECIRNPISTGAALLFRELLIKTRERIQSILFDTRVTTQIETTKYLKMIKESIWDQFQPLKIIRDALGRTLCISKLTSDISSVEGPKYDNHPTKQYFNRNTKTLYITTHLFT